MTWKICNSQKYAAGGTAWEIDINTAGTFTLLSSGTVDVDVYWGDGDVETVTTNSVAHVYPAPGTYTIGIVINSGDFRPYYNNNAAGDEIITLGDTPDGWSFGTDLLRAFQGADNLTTIGNIDTSAVTSFSKAWYFCTGLESFPEIDASNVTNFREAWQGCTSLTSFLLTNTSKGEDFFYCWRDCTGLTSFPLIDTSSAIDLTFAWRDCTSLESFPLIDTSSVTNLFGAWQGCSSLDNITALGEQYSFPLIDLSVATSLFKTWQLCSSLTSFPELPAGKRPVAATTFQEAWRNCTGLTDFPASMFDTTGVLIASAFTFSWEGCALTAQSIENILVSLDTNGASSIDLDIDGGTNASKATWSVAANTAYDNLIGKSWTIGFNP
jgi:hypothetical protein